MISFVENGHTGVAPAFLGCRGGLPGTRPNIQHTTRVVHAGKVSGRKCKPTLHLEKGLCLRGARSPFGQGALPLQVLHQVYDRRARFR